MTMTTTTINSSGVEWMRAGGGIRRRDKKNRRSFLLVLFIFLVRRPRHPDENLPRILPAAEPHPTRGKMSRGDRILVVLGGDKVLTNIDRQIVIKHHFYIYIYILTA